MERLINDNNSTSVINVVSTLILRSFDAAGHIDDDRTLR